MSLVDASWLPPWLRRQFTVIHDDGRCIRIQLFHMAGKTRGVKTWSFRDPVEAPTDQNVDEMVRDVLNTAQEDASDIFGKQRYGLYAYHERRPDQVAESKIFTCIGGGEGDDDDIEAEGPNSRGLTAQAMRHTEQAMRLAVGSAQQQLRALGESYEVTQSRLTASEAQRFQQAQIYEGMLTERHVRDLATKESELKMRALGEGIEKLSLLIPVVVNGIAGRRLLPESQTIADAMVGELVESISPEQMAKLQETLRPEQLIVVVNLMKRRGEQLEQMRAEAAEKDAARKAAAEGKGARRDA